MGIKNYFLDFCDLLIPECCSTCQSPLVTGEKCICISCLSKLDYTNFWKQEENALIDLLRVRNGCEFAFALSYFNKTGICREILHSLKYKDNEKLAIEMGKIAGFKLSEMTEVHEYDTIVPVPISVKRRRKRAYNQSEKIAIGMNYFLKMKLVPTALRRKNGVASLTRLSKEQRLRALTKVFYCPDKTLLHERSILLIDDVYTTGATANACLDIIQEGGAKKVGFACLAFNANY